MNRSKGFTLLEVVMAMAIVAIALVSLVEATGTYVRNTSFLRDKVIANWVATNALNLTIIKKSFPDKGAIDGSEEMAGQQWRWKINITETPNPYMRQIEVKVHKGDAKTSMTALKSTVSSAVVECAGASNSAQVVACP